MHNQDRRAFLLASASALAGATLGRNLFAQLTASSLKLATFRFDATPPIGHSLCGGWIKPATEIDQPLSGLGVVITGAEKPIVICSLDWTGLLNSAHVAFRTALAEAAGTTPDRVAVHCLHPHNAPFACLDAQKIVAQYPELPAIVNVEFFQRCLADAAKAVREALPLAKPVTHVAGGKAIVKQVAANRRILGPDGKVQKMRGSACSDPELRAAPEGLIDPLLRTVAFYHGEQRMAALHYYACHPMSYYGDGKVTPDFCGLARQRLQDEDPGCTHLYFDGCGGNIGAGKYNDGSPAMRPVLVDRIYAGLTESIKSLKPQPIQHAAWSTREILPPPSDKFQAEVIRKQIADPNQSVVSRNRPSYTLAWLERCAAGGPAIILSGLHINDITILHLPAESFVEYQLQAQQSHPDRFVACAAYGDGGPWYIPKREAYSQGGYEVGVAWCDPKIDDILTQGIQSLFPR